MDGAGHELSRGRCRPSETRSEQLVNDLPRQQNLSRPVPPIGADSRAASVVYPATRVTCSIARWNSVRTPARARCRSGTCRSCSVWEANLSSPSGAWHISRAGGERTPLPCISPSTAAKCPLTSRRGR